MYSCSLFNLFYVYKVNSEVRWMDTHTMIIIKHLIGINKHPIKIIEIQVGSKKFDILRNQSRRTTKTQEEFDIEMRKS